MEKRVISTEFVKEDYAIESSLRPLYLEDYIGQDKVKRNLKFHIRIVNSSRNVQPDSTILGYSSDHGLVIPK